MTKKLFIIRHGKSDWSNPDLRDFDRPLKNRGIRNAQFMAGLLKKQGITPDRVLTSPAKRALDTATIFLDILGVPPEKLQTDKSIYLAEPEHLLKLIRMEKDEIRTLLIFGHNPDLTSLVNIFLPKSVFNIPTAGIVHLAFKTAQWKKIDKKNLVDHYFDFPRKYA